MPSEHFYNFIGGRHRIQYTLALSPSSAKITLVFLHGIGDSSENYTRFLNDPDFKNYNIFIPDMLGYGESKCEEKPNDFSFNRNLDVLNNHLAQICNESQCDLGKVVVVGHSMGGDLGVLLCSTKSALKDQIAGFVDVEGSLTEHDTFVSSPASASAKDNKFDSWFKDYKEKIAPSFTNSGNYIRSLSTCNLTAFKQNAVELYKKCEDAKSDSICMKKGFTHTIAKMYDNLSIPKTYYYGRTTDSKTQDFIKASSDQWHPVFFDTNSHWVIQNCYDDFKRCLQNFIKQAIKLKPTSFSMLIKKTKMAPHSEK